MRNTWILAGLLSTALPQIAAAQSGAATAGEAPPFAELDRAVRAGEFKAVTSVVVMRAGNVVHEAYYKGDADTLRNTRSLTESVTALLVGAAIDRKMIRGVREPVAAWFVDAKPLDHPDPRKDAITVEDLLTMSSILECDDENNFSRGNEERMYLVEDWIGFTLGLPIRGAAPWETPPAKQPYGRAWHYCTAGVSTLGALLERASRKPLAKFADEALHRPLGIGKIEWQYAPKGFAQAGGGAAYRTRDLAKIAELVRSGGKWNGKQIISRAYIEAMTTPKAHISDERGDYGYLTWLPPMAVNGRNYRAWGMFGSGGNRAMIIPELELVAVITAENFGNREAHSLSQKLLETLILPEVLARP